MAKKCVNGNCSRRHECGMYHQALNTLEASGANGKFDRHSCRKGKCDHYLPKEYMPYGAEWFRVTSKLPKNVIIAMFASLAEEHASVKAKYESLQVLCKSLEVPHA